MNQLYQTVKNIYAKKTGATVENKSFEVKPEKMIFEATADDPPEVRELVKTAKELKNEITKLDNLSSGKIKRVRKLGAEFSSLLEKSTRSTVPDSSYPSAVWLTRYKLNACRNASACLGRRLARKEKRYRRIVNKLSALGKGRSQEKEASKKKKKGMGALAEAEKEILAKADKLMVEFAAQMEPDGVLGAIADNTAQIHVKPPHPNENKFMFNYSDIVSAVDSPPPAKIKYYKSPLPRWNDIDEFEEDEY